MYARLRRRWAGASLRIPIAFGGWYPAQPFAGGYQLKVDGETLTFSETLLELREAAPIGAVWGCLVDHPEDGAVLICPEGHHIEGIGPWQGRVRCPICGKDYDVEAA